MANLAEDEQREKEEENRKYDLLLAFVDGEMFKKYDDLRSGRAASTLKGEGEVDAGTAGSEFFSDVEKLPGLRISKPPLVDDYIVGKMRKLEEQLRRKGVEISSPATGNPGDKAFHYERKIIPKK